ncbi:hypothetical protein PVAND_000429 [Polypedilum vanderplanki]|uniref:F-box domain-containing protein n=1 Tax=Polypedilum vanderplanki TaxID=319348 RepID=A0A9J6BKX4_POLVA|nr:hypothetical protein PVAND_000429 [Polypedilum vanderplanki]
MFDDWNNLPDNVTREIFSYLNFKDLFLNASFVCQSWYDYIGKSKECMDKVRLKIEGWHDLEIISDILLRNSPRIYNSLIFYNLNAEKKFPYLLQRRWKDVKLTQMKFISAKKFYEYLKEFGEDLESLEIERIVIIKGDEMCDQTLVLPKLRHLKLKQVPTSAFQVFQRYPNIKSLHFDIPAFGSKRREDITDFFEKFRDVNLKQLTICRNSLYGLPETAHKLIESIIISMTATLDYIELKNWGYCHTLECIWNAMKAKYFSINVCSHVPITRNLLDLSPNTYLKSFTLSLLIEPEIEWFKRLFLLTPNLEELKISLIRKEVVYLAAHYLRKLKVLSYKSCIIEVACEEHELDEFSEEEEDSDPGSNYNFLGPNEVFELSKFNERPNMVKRYKDEKLSIDFAYVYYRELISRETNINQHIRLEKLSFDNWK